MKCKNHPQADAIGVCVGCGAGVCEQCRVTLGGRTYCQPCADRAFEERPAEAPATPREQAPGAVTSLVCALIGFMIWPLGIILGPIAIYYANQAREAIRANPALDGSGLATIGYVLGIVITVLGALGVLYIILMFTCAFSGFWFAE